MAAGTGEAFPCEQSCSCPLPQPWPWVVWGELGHGPRAQCGHSHCTAATALCIPPALTMAAGRCAPRLSATALFPPQQRWRGPSPIRQRRLLTSHFLHKPLPPAMASPLHPADTGAAPGTAPYRHRRVSFPSPWVLLCPAHRTNAGRSVLLPGLMALPQRRKGKGAASCGSQRHCHSSHTSSPTAKEHRGCCPGQGTAVLFCLFLLLNTPQDAQR